MARSRTAITLSRVRRLVPTACNRDTSYRNNPLWSTDNPTLGHCVVAALLVQDLFGGELLRVSLDGTPFADGRFHYYNRLPDKTVVDLTREQFQGRFPDNRVPIVRRRTEVLRVADVVTRYRRFRKRFFRAATS